MGFIILFVAHTIGVDKKMKKLSGLSQQEKLKKVKGENIYKITPEIRKELEALAQMPDNEIDTIDSDSNEISNWDNANVGKFYRPIKKLISIRLDMDVLDWFKRRDEKYQSLINRICREYMEKHRESSS